MNIDMMTAQKICGSSTIRRGPGVTFSAIRAPSRIAVVPDPGMPSVSSGTNEPVQAALFADLRRGQTLDRALAELFLLLLRCDVAFDGVAQERWRWSPQPPAGRR